MVRLVLLVLLLILSAGPACIPLAPGGILLTEAARTEGAFSGQRIVADRGHAVMVGQVLVLRRDGVTALTAEVGQVPHGGQVRYRMQSAWHEGRALPFRRAARAEVFCTAPGHCRGYRTGTFVFTAEAFEDAAAHGFSATLIGPDAVVRVRFPAAMFTEARNRAAAADLWPGT